MGLDVPQSNAPCVQSQHCLFDAMADALAGPGWGVFPNALSDDMLHDLFKIARSKEYSRPARVGRRRNQQHNPRIRRDNIVWIDGSHPTQQAWLDWSAQLQLWLNRSLMVGLSFFESHFASYAPGAFYAKHLDTFQGPNQQMLSERAVSVVLYLNPDWLPGHGGELVLYRDGGEAPVKIAPSMGSLVLFNSADFLHEVLPAGEQRYSIAGWFHRQPASALALPVA